MTPAEEKQLIADIQCMKDDLDELKTILAGDRIKGVTGILDILETHRRELYGNEPTQDVGLKDRQVEVRKRVESLENDRARIYVISGTVSVVVGILWTLIKTFFIK